MDTCLSEPLDEGKLQEVLAVARDYALSHGLVMRTKEQPQSNERVIHAPFILLPSPVSKNCFLAAQRVQADINLLMHRVAMDYNFMREALQSTIKVDEFTKGLWDIYETVRQEGISQSVYLGLLRSDYMQHEEPNSGNNGSAPSGGERADSLQLRQIEVNTIASSFGGLCSQVSKYHRFLLRYLGLDEAESRLPANPALEGLARGMLAAWEAYGQPNTAILFVVGKTERNVYDQRWLEYAIYEQNSNVKVIRATFEDIDTRASLDERKALILNGQEVAVIYFRYGYTEGEYQTEKDWAIRLKLERSKAVKCPSISYQLAGTKKIQQVLSKPGAVEKFISDKQTADRIRATFAGLYSLDWGEEGDRAVAIAMKDPKKYVLKPQREGGGNNLFDDEITACLKEVGQSEARSAYILMERVFPPVIRNYLVRVGDAVVQQDMVSELGVFGIFVGTEEKVIENFQSGHILRSKAITTNEGGVAAGYAALDSPYLI